MTGGRRLSCALAVLIALLGFGPATATAESASLPDIEDEVMCPICGTTLELSESPQADRERELIRRLIDRGLTKEQIKDELVAEYGEEVLAAPDTEGFDLSAWLVPGVGLALGGLLIAVAMIRLGRRKNGDGEVAEALDPADSARLERDITSYDL